MTSLPPGYRLLDNLSGPDEAGRCVVRARWSGPDGDEERVVRVGDEGTAELAVLAAVDHPGLARLLDHGVLPDGRRYVARTWIEGRDLAEWALGGVSHAEIGAVLARLGPALEHLHERGFVHADLKARNVIVTGDGAPVVTDFGLARSVGEAASTVAGNLFGLAPEVLRGRPVDSRSDLFALGVMLHELLVRERPPASEFYGRFPAEDFFTATCTSPADLPEWARDVAVSLVSRDPARRPASAAQVGRTLAARLGVALSFEGGEPALRWPVRTGRREWCERWRARPEGLQWLRFPSSEDPRPLLDEVALVAALAGHPVRRIDLDHELREVRDEAQLDDWARRTNASSAKALLLAAVPREGAWARKGIAALARTLRQARGEAELIVGSTEVPAGLELEWTAFEVPPITTEIVLAHLREFVEGDEARLAELAARLAEACAGSATKLDALLARGSRAGWFLVGDERPRLRTGALAVDVDVDGARIEVGADAVGVLAALHVAGGAAPMAELGELAEFDPARMTRAIDELRDGGLVRHTGGGDDVERTVVSLESVKRLPGEDRWRALHARRAVQLERVGAQPVHWLPHRWHAQQVQASEVIEVVEEFLDHGTPELALDLLDSVLAGAHDSDRVVAASFICMRGLAWCAAGELDRARADLAQLSDDAPEVRADSARLRAGIAALEHDPSTALAELERAARLNPAAASEAHLARARLLYELGRDGEVRALAKALPAAMRPRARQNLRAIEAMSAFRVGEVDLARASLVEQLAEATGDPGREAGLRLNLATIERRSGDPAAAVAQLERAVGHYEAAGRLPGLAQARAMLGSLLRDRGQLVRARELLESARELRERLGDSAGAAAALGMLGLVHADCGHARAATGDLERAADELRARGRSRDALLLAARAREMRARIGEDAPAGRDDEAARMEEGDPRVLVSLARAARLCGDDERATELAARAGRLAERLGLKGIGAEAEHAVRGPDGDARDARANEIDGESLAAGDARLWSVLARAPFDIDTALALAEELESSGRDDRAARLLLGCGARAVDKRRAAEWIARGEALFARCAAGLSPVEAAAARRTLLGVPDPWPEDMRAVERGKSTDEELEMEMIRLLEINHRLVRQEDVTSLLGTIVEHALDVSGAQRGFLILEEDGELVVDTALDSRRGGIEAPDVEVSGSVLRRALERMQPIRISNAVDDPLLGAAPSVVDLELRSILCAPFEVQPGLRGVIYVDHRLREAAFDERVERLLTLLADQAALAIRQVRRMQEIRSLNRELERRVVRQETDLATARQRLRVAGLPRPAGGLVGDSPPMRAVHELIQRAAVAELPVLVTGESGSGKELAARALHDLGPRSSGPFVSENCAAIPASLIEAELFGAKRGAFTGADRDRTGLFERAHHGTLFLDEIGELPLELQSKLLRVLEMGEVRRIGDTATRQVDFRLVVATNRDLHVEVAEERFRADLYYRLDGLTIRMPAMSEHPEDIPALVAHYLRTQAGDEAPREVTKAVMARLCRREWPGNVRELFNELARLCVLAEGVIDDPDLVRVPQSVSAPTISRTRVRPLEELEREAIEHAVEVAGGDKREAAAMLGISRAKIYQRLKDWAAAVPPV
jgi:transcriptional regulator with GAF, ATPase, and Fis domain